MGERGYGHDLDRAVHIHGDGAEVITVPEKHGAGILIDNLNFPIAYSVGGWRGGALSLEI